MNLPLNTLIMIYTNFDKIDFVYFSLLVSCINMMFLVVNENLTCIILELFGVYFFNLIC